MRYPEFLKDNGTLGFVAPSFGCGFEPYISAFENSMKALSDLGFGMHVGPNCFAASGIGISNEPRLCGKELTDMYVSRGNDVLLSVGGGELMCEILEHIDWVKIKSAKAKWFAGYSDNTNFTYLNTVNNHVATIYSPCAGAFGMEPWHSCMKDLYSVLTGAGEVKDGAMSFTFKGYEAWEKESLKSAENPLAGLNCTEKSMVRAYIGDKEVESCTVSGRLLGGCMDVLVNLLGTRFDGTGEFLESFKEDGFLWFLESCDLNVFAIRRAMWQMEQAGWFKYAKGFIIGRPLVMGQEMMGLDQYSAVLGIIGKYGLPVIMDADIGHISPSMPIICGSVGTAIYANGSYSLEMSLR